MYHCGWRVRNSCSQTLSGMASRGRPSLPRNEPSSTNLNNFRENSCPNSPGSSARQLWEWWWRWSLMENDKLSYSLHPIIQLPGPVPWGGSSGRTLLHAGIGTMLQWIILIWVVIRVGTDLRISSKRCWSQIGTFCHDNRMFPRRRCWTTAADVGLLGFVPSGTETEKEWMIYGDKVMYQRFIRSEWIGSRSFYLWTNK